MPYKPINVNKIHFTKRTEGGNILKEHLFEKVGESYG